MIRRLILMLCALLLPVSALAEDVVCRSVGPGAWSCTQVDAPLAVFRIVTIGDILTNTHDGILMSAGSAFCNGQQVRPEVVRNSCLVVVAPLNEDGLFSGRHRVYAQWYEFPQ